MTSKLRCAVIGAGAAGSAAAYALARRGADVHLFEQYELFHVNGSSHGATRLFRIAYYEHPDYVPLLQRAAALWRDLEAASGDALLYQTGILMAGYDDGIFIPGNLEAARRHDLPIECLSSETAVRRFPWFSFPSEMQLMIEPDAGFVRADLAIAAFVRGAADKGARIRDKRAVRAWSPASRGVEVETADGTESFDRLIVAPGAWATPLLGDIGVIVSPVRKNLFWVAPGDDRFALNSGFPPFAVEQRDKSFFYGFPAVDNDGVKTGEHTGGLPVGAPEDPMTDERREEDAARQQRFLKTYAPGLPHAITKAQACLYEASPDGHFIIDRHPADERVSFAIGMSGHGFKFAPLIGEALADLAAGAPLAPEFGFLSLSRFRN